MKFKNVLTTIKNFGSKNSSAILIAIGSAGMVASAILTVPATVKAVDIIRAEEKRKQDTLTKKEVAKLCWKLYVPSVTVGALSIGCLTGSASLYSKKNAALATACEITRTTLHDYRKEVKEALGEEKEKEVMNKAADKQNTFVPATKEVCVVSDGILVIEPLTGRKFTVKSYEDIRKALNELNLMMISEMYVSTNDWYELLGLDPVAKDEGWAISEGLLELREPAVSRTEDYKLILELVYDRDPRENYYRFG